jgi:hypothetical protein
MSSCLQFRLTLLSNWERCSTRMSARSLSNLRLLWHVTHFSDNLSQIAIRVGAPAGHAGQHSQQRTRANATVRHISSTLNGSCAHARHPPVSLDRRRRVGPHRGRPGAFFCLFSLVSRDANEAPESIASTPTSGRGGSSHRDTERKPKLARLFLDREHDWNVKPTATRPREFDRRINSRVLRSSSEPVFPGSDRRAIAHWAIARPVGGGFRNLRHSYGWLLFPSGDCRLSSRCIPTV